VHRDRLAIIFYIFLQVKIKLFLPTVERNVILRYAIERTLRYDIGQILSCSIRYTKNSYANKTWKWYKFFSASNTGFLTYWKKLFNRGKTPVKNQKIGSFASSWQDREIRIRFTKDKSEKIYIWMGQREHFSR